MKKYDKGDKEDKKDRMGWVVCSGVEWWAGADIVWGGRGAREAEDGSGVRSRWGGRGRWAGRGGGVGRGRKKVGSGGLEWEGWRRGGGARKGEVGGGVVKRTCRFLERRPATLLCELLGSRQTL